MSKSILILQGIVVAVDALTIVFLVVAARLFSDAYLSLLNEYDSIVCPLYLKGDYSSKNDPCVLAIFCEIFAALCIMLLIFANMLKYVRQDYKNKPVLIIEIIVLVITVIFALMGMIILSSGWGVTCESLLGGTCTSNDMGKKITTSVAFAVFSIPAIATTFIITIVIVVMTFTQSTNTPNA